MNIFNIIGLRFIFSSIKIRNSRHAKLYENLREAREDVIITICSKTSFDL